jgi:Flp pilus assembly protein TadB
LTGYVLMALPAALTVTLSFINPDHVNLLFEEHLGNMMILAAIILQVVGYIWISQVVKIEV